VQLAVETRVFGCVGRQCAVGCRDGLSAQYAILPDVHMCVWLRLFSLAVRCNFTAAEVFAVVTAKHYANFTGTLADTLTFSCEPNLTIPDNTTKEFTCLGNSSDTFNLNNLAACSGGKFLMFLPAITKQI